MMANFDTQGKGWRVESSRLKIDGGESRKVAWLRCRRYKPRLKLDSL